MAIHFSHMIIGNYCIASYKPIGKPYWISNSVTIKPKSVLKDKLARSVGRELSGTYSNKNHQQLAENLMRTHQRFSKSLCNFGGNAFLFDSDENGFERYS